MKLERCFSHEKHNSPAAFECVLDGTPAEIVAYYNDLTHTQRVSNAYRVRDGEKIVTISDFLYAHVPSL